MSLLLSRRLSRLLRLGKPALERRSSLLLLSNDLSSSSLQQTPPCSIAGAISCGSNLGRLFIINANEDGIMADIDEGIIDIDKKVPMELVYNDGKTVTIGASHGWVATLNKYEGILRLQDDLNPYASDTDPKRISLPPLVALPHCQTRIVTNVSMSSSSPEDEDCVVAVKFLGPQLSFCRPAVQSEWTNVRIENPSFSSRVMFSKKDCLFRIPGSGGHLIGSWDPCKPSDNPKLQSLRFQNLHKLLPSANEIMHSCSTTEHLVESRTTGETFLVKIYRSSKIIDGVAKMQTYVVLTLKLDEEGNAVLTLDIGDLVIFLSKTEPFCVPASSFPGLIPNHVYISDVDEFSYVDLSVIELTNYIGTYPAPYHIPPQNID